jgi:hypothetical protein
MGTSFPKTRHCLPRTQSPVCQTRLRAAVRDHRINHLVITAPRRLSRAASSHDELDMITARKAEDIAITKERMAHRRWSGTSATPPVNANVNVHVKMMIFPAPEKFNTFNTFNTLDLIASCHSAHHSASGMAARLVEESSGREVDSRESLITPGPLRSHLAVFSTSRLLDRSTRFILHLCVSSRASGADFS